MYVSNLLHFVGRKITLMIGSSKTISSQYDNIIFRRVLGMYFYTSNFVDQYKIINVEKI